MSKYRGPRLRIMRRIGSLNPGFTNKISKKKSPPGFRGSAIKIKRKISKYRIRLQEKQRLRFFYGITERQLLNYVKKARRKKGSSGRLLLNLLEMRLDTIVYRLGFAKTMSAARQLVNHGHFSVDNKIINIPSFICQPKNKIKVKFNLVSENLVREHLNARKEESKGKIKKVVVPPHLILNESNLEGEIRNLVQRNYISFVINELLVMEYYSRKL